MGDSGMKKGKKIEVSVMVTASRFLESWIVGMVMDLWGICRILEGFVEQFWVFFFSVLWSNSDFFIKVLSLQWSVPWNHFRYKKFYFSASFWLLIDIDISKIKKNLKNISAT